MNKAAALRELFASEKLIRIVGAHNGATAKLVEGGGFEGVWASSLEVSASHAVPDANILTMTDYLNAAISMNDAVSIPVVVDVDQGYGNSMNVIRMIKKFEAAGIAGVIMEDKKFPKQNSLLAGGRQELASVSEFVGKIMAAKNAQETKEFMVIARVEALIAGWGQEEAMKRAKAYVEAGVDGIMIHSKKSDPTEIIEFVKKWDKNVPLVIVPTTYSGMDEKMISRYPKIKMVIYANHVMRSIIKSVKETLDEIQISGGVKTVSPKLATLKEVFELQGTYEMKANEERFLGLDKESITAIIPIAGRPPKSLAHVLPETPLALLDINGKSLLKRNIEGLKSLGITKIILVAGYNHERLNASDVEDVSVIINEDYENSGSIHSIMLAKEELEGRVLVLFGDILFEPELIEKLLKSDKDITISIDKSYTKSKFKDKKLDLVVAKYSPIKGSRILNPRKYNIISQIGQDIPRTEANFEFCGVTLLSKKGTNSFKDTVRKLVEKGEVKNLDMDHTLQEMINQGHTIYAQEVSEGWIEMNTFQNYKDACEMLSQKE